MRDIDLIVWDLDGTKYPFPSDIDKIARQNLAEIVEETFQRLNKPALPRDLIMDLSTRSFQERGLSWLVFTEDYGLPWQELHQSFNDRMPLTTVGLPCARYRAFMEKTIDMGTDHAIFTHGSRSWARRVLDQIGLGGLIPDSRIFDLVHTEQAMKHHGRTAYDHIFMAMNRDPARSVMVEDSWRNLIGARDIGMTTVLIDRAGTHGEKPTIADYIFHTPQDFLDAYIRAKQ